MCATVLQLQHSNMYMHVAPHMGEPPASRLRRSPPARPPARLPDGEPPDQPWPGNAAVPVFLSASSSPLHRTVEVCEERWDEEKQRTNPRPRPA